MKPAGFVLRRSVFYIVIAIVVACFGSLRPSSAQSPVPVEIVELARALKNNPDLIYEYVYNNIETLPQHGSLKGALGTLLDGKGTAFDQAELMVALLQQSGLTASYQIGEIQYTTDQLTNWLGIDTAVGRRIFRRTGLRQQPSMRTKRRRHRCQIRLGLGRRQYRRHEFCV